MIGDKFANLAIDMNPITNPYAPGAGAPPPALAGRDDLRERVHVAIERARRGRHAKSVILVGLRGVGKTVLLDRMRLDCEAEGNQTIRVEAPEGRSLPAILAPRLRSVLLSLSRVAAAKDLADRGLRALVGFARSLKVTFNDIEVGLDREPEPGLADNGDLETDLGVLLEQAGLAARQAGVAIALFIDELQYVEESQLAALISALHHCSQRQLPIVMVGAGLPQLRGRAGNAKSYAERLFDYPDVGPLTREEDLRQALIEPALEEGVEYTDGAFRAVLAHTGGYPYFLQEWGSSAWKVATTSPITEQDVEEATEQAISELDQSFFMVRFDRLTPAEKSYLRAMAELGAGPHRSGEIAAKAGRTSASLAPIRNNLIQKGMIWSPSHGDTAFTVPLFDAFLKRVMPEFEPG